MKRAIYHRIVLAVNDGRFGLWRSAIEMVLVHGRLRFDPYLEWNRPDSEYFVPCWESTGRALAQVREKYGLKQVEIGTRAYYRLRRSTPKVFDAFVSDWLEVSVAVAKIAVDHARQKALNPNWPLEP